MTITDEQAEKFAETFDRLVSAVGSAILGKDRVVRLALTCLLSDGHLLLEDVPGTGKTSLARAIANSVKGTTARIQFTPDLLPSDVIGGVVYNQNTQEFDFKPGPVFHSIVLADEINRASPKTQSALLEVMEEGRVTVDGKAHDVDRPFMVIATQNPVEHAGTYPLPEAQLDRFLMKTAIGYPDQGSLVELMSGTTVRDRAGLVEPVISSENFARMAEFATGVTVREEVLIYISQIAEATRTHKYVDLGLSTRGCMAYVRAAKTWAIAQGRNFVTPDDVRNLRKPVLGHRLLLSEEAPYHDVTVDQVIDEVFDGVAPPMRRTGTPDDEYRTHRRDGSAPGAGELTQRRHTSEPDEHTRRREPASEADEHTRRREAAGWDEDNTRRRTDRGFGQGDQ
jgi:MoxR-like ATPase